MINGIKANPVTDRMFGQVLQAMYGINRRELWQQPYAVRVSIREVVYSVMSALLYGSASSPENTDALEDQR